MSPTESIDLLIADGIVDALIQRVKTGKEAEVFIVQKGENFFAAKVYKERTDRNFKNNAAYREGRAVRNTRDARAIAKGSKYGLSISEADWRHMEHDALVTAAAAGLRVPKPELIYEGILLMELVLGADGQPAPRLIEVPLSREEALAHHRDIVSQIIGLLSCDLIHGDLSPYNILMAWNGPTIIDLPQVIKAAHNNQAEQFLVRDVRNVTEHFARFAPELKKRVHDGYAIWRKYMKRELTPEYFPEEGEAQPPKQTSSHSAPHARPPQHHPRPGGAPPRPAGQPAPAHTHRPSPGPRDHGRPNHQPPRTPAVPAAPVAKAAPQPQAKGVPHHPHTGGHRPQQQRSGPPPRGNGQAPRRPDTHRRPNPPGPVIERVTRLAPVSSSGEASAPGEPRPSRFSQHHRHRQG